MLPLRARSGGLMAKREIQIRGGSRSSNCPGGNASFASAIWRQAPTCSWRQQKSIWYHVRSSNPTGPIQMYRITWLPVAPAVTPSKANSFHQRIIRWKSRQAYVKECLRFISSQRLKNYLRYRDHVEKVLRERAVRERAGE